MPNLDELIALAKSQAPSADPIDELAAAAALKSELDELTDAVLGHFVDQARRAGRSWTQIGAALGVTKQAAQQRHTSTDAEARRILFPMLEAGFLSRFTTRAKAAVAGAQQRATDLQHGYIGTEHLLLGLYVDPEALATKILVEGGLSAERCEAAVLEHVQRGAAPVSGLLPFTPRAKGVLEHSLAQALQLGHNYIGTEHVLLGVLAEAEGVGGQVLAAAGFTIDGVRGQVIQLLAGLPR